MTASQSFVIGDSVILDVYMYRRGVLTDPTTLTILVEEPDLTNNTVAAEGNSTGFWGGNFVPDQAGWHQYRITGTGTAPFRVEGRFYVASSGIVL